jgi:carbon-monoxide dehydrogenase small subunit
MEVTLVVIGEERTLAVDARTLLVHALRDQCGSMGTKVGCDTSQCGACTVLVDGAAIKSCTVLAVQLDGAAITTVEGLGGTDGDHPLQRAFVSQHGLQCGFCTPGMLMAATDLLSRDPDPDAASVRVALKGNLCRCTGYSSIVQSVLAAAAELRGA